MATKKSKGKVVARTGVTRRKGYLYFVDGKGDVRETKAKRGGTKGRRTCTATKPAKTKRKPTKRKR